MKKQNIQKYAKIILIIPIIVYILLSVNIPAVNAETGPKAVQGELDLQNKVIVQDGPFTLNGGWEFYWQELVAPKDNGEMNSPTIVPVPDVWNNYEVAGKSPSKYGFATYRLTLHLNEADIGQIVSFYMPGVATAYRLWVNEELIASNGLVGKSREQMVPKNYSKTVSFKADSEKIELVLQVSNFHQRKAGLWEPITFGTAEQITQLRERNILSQIFVIGCIFIIGFYHLVIFLIRPKEKAFLFLAIVCFGVALRTSLLRDTLLIDLFPQISWEVATSLEYLSALMSILFFLLFVKTGRLLDIPTSMIKFFVTFLISYSLFVSVTPARIFTNTFSFFQLLVSLIMICILLFSFKSIKQRRKGSYLNLLAIIVLTIAVSNDIFYYNNWISTDEFVSLGILFYLFTQSVHLARRFSRSFNKVEGLSLELKELNHLLEQKVGKRTEGLQVANDSLQKIEQARRRLLASVSHELNTPLTFIQGYIEAMIDGVISKDDSTYLRAIYSDTQMMAYMIHDLQELSKLESGQVTFQLENVDIRAFLSQLYEEQKSVVRKKEHHFYYNEKVHSDLDGTQINCSLDTMRIKQVFMNLIINAQKFTPSGGTITIDVEIPSFANKREIKVSVMDTGAGIAEKDLPYIFERFYKVNQSKEIEEKGAGLGLAIVKEIIEYHKGSVGVTSEQGRGSTFFFILPIYQKKGRIE